MSKTFIINVMLKFAKHKQKLSNTLEAEVLLFQNYSLSSSTLSPKNNRAFSKKCMKNRYVCLNEVIYSMTMKMRLKMKNRWHRYDINRHRLRHGCKYTKYEMCLTIMMVICTKQHLSNIWRSIYERVKQH